MRRANQIRKEQLKVLWLGIKPRDYLEKEDSVNLADKIWNMIINNSGRYGLMKCNQLNIIMTNRFTE
jgi:hypothetical protein